MYFSGYQPNSFGGERPPMNAPAQPAFMGGRQSWGWGRPPAPAPASQPGAPAPAAPDAAPGVDGAGWTLGGGPETWGQVPVYNGKWSDTQSVRDMIANMYRGGFMNPYGTPGYAAMYANAGQRQVNDAVGRAETAADISGLTPEQAQFARTMAGVNASGGAARGYADFTMQDAIGNRDFMRKLIEMHYGHNYNYGQQKPK